MDDLLAAWTTVIDGFTERVNAVADDQWDAPTPCDGWSVRELVAHAADAQRMIPRQLGANPDIMLPIGGDPPASWGRIVAAAKAALGSPGALDHVVKGPFGAAPVRESLGIPTTDVLVHTWDLARAIGADETLPTDIVAHAFEALRPMERALRGPGIMGPAVAVADDASIQDRFIAFTGRRP
jgi:uncharacterized protein (TIGR03086 family)